MRALIVANWKMNPSTFADAKRLLDVTRKAAERAKQVSVIILPPTIYMRDLRQLYKGKKLSFGVQHAHFEDTGAHTGDISPLQARDAKASYMLIGHAERRAAGETNDDTRKKVAAALARGLAPILCVGEAKRAASGEHFSFIAEQLRVGFADVLPAKVAKVIVAYEPIWAIGAPKPMQSTEMHEMAIFIRKTLQGKGFNALSVKILYGGAIDETTAADMMRNGDVAGLLVGRASSDPQKCAALIAAVNEA